MKDSMRNRLVRLTERVADRLGLQTELRVALERQEFFLVYQPKVDLAEGRICGFEALASSARPTPAGSAASGQNTVMALSSLWKPMSARDTSLQAIRSRRLRASLSRA